jgi:hypothetical protein
MSKLYKEWICSGCSADCSVTAVYKPELCLYINGEGFDWHVYDEEKPDSHLKPIIDLVSEQAEDEGLWFIAQTAPEAYLQQELRKLHSIIEEVIK